MEIQEYIDERLTQQLQWYEVKARSARTKSLIFQAYLLIFLLTIPLVLLTGELFGLGGDFGALVASALAIGGAVLSVMTNYMRLDTKADQYRFIAERLKREHLSYEMSLGEYENLDPEQKERLFVERAESLLDTELSRWFAGDRRETVR